MVGILALLNEASLLDDDEEDDYDVVQRFKVVRVVNVIWDNLQPIQQRFVALNGRTDDENPVIFHALDDVHRYARFSRTPTAYH